jgi:CRISPR-associated protein Cas2
MPYVIIYDITKDSLRNRVASKLKDYGLRRIQYSAFIGDLRARNLRSLVTDLKKMLGKAGREDERKVVHIFPVPFSSLESVIIIGEWKEEKEKRRAKVF